jgi:ketosteroid isomerase-like protein
MIRPINWILLCGSILSLKIAANSIVGFLLRAKTWELLFLAEPKRAPSVEAFIPETARDTKSIENVLKGFSEWYSSPMSLDITNQKKVQLPSILSGNVQWMDCHYMYKPLLGADTVERHLRLQKINLLGSLIATKFVIDQVIVDSDESIDRADQSSTKVCFAVGFTFQLTERTNGSAEGMAIPNRRGIVLLDLETTQNADVGYRYCISAANIIREKSFKSGELSLPVVSFASRLLGQPTKNNTLISNELIESKLTLPQRYFVTWNKRDMEAAMALFSENIVYDDTAFLQPIEGKESLLKHLKFCAACFPPSFSFHIDRMLQRQQEQRSIVSWHVENGGVTLPFTEGLSYYEYSESSQLITKGVDFVDSESIKIAILQDPLVALFRHEPIRLLPTLVWLSYMYIVFFSEGVLPGKNALQLEVRTWEEVRDLSLNFFLVAPVLKLPFSPVVHPMLEGVFNIVLSWAALFAGFLSDDRRTKPNLLPMLPLVVGMQFLTSAFLLPYLITRSPEHEGNNDKNSTVTMSDLDFPSQITETKVWGPILGFVGIYSLVWSIVGRWTEFGDLSERWVSFTNLLSIDRVGSSFIVDLVIFTCFQGWLVDEDLQRRGVPTAERMELRRLAKFVPFLGLAAYLTLRPPFPATTVDHDE